MPHPSFESPRPPKAELSAQEHLDNISFQFEDRLRKNLNAAELSGEGTYPWSEYVRRSKKLLTSSVPKEELQSVRFARENLTLALAAREALPGNPEEQAMILKQFKAGHTGRMWDRALIALSAYKDIAPLLDKTARHLDAAKTAAFHDWHDAIDFDSLKLPRRDMADPKKTEVYDLFKYDHLIDDVVDLFVERGWNVPITPDNKLDIESLMNRAYQENLVPEATHQKFENDMESYFESTKNMKNKQ